MALPINIENLIKGTTVEWERIEFKKGWNPLPVMHTMCAFANDLHNWGGGYIIVGVDENSEKPILPPVGLKQDSLDKIQKEIIKLAHLIQPNYIPIIQPYVLHDKHILVIWCPAGDRRIYTAPKTLDKNSQRKPHVRVGSQTIIAKGETLRQLQELAVRIPFDDQVNQQASMKNLDLALIQAYLYKVGSGLYEESTKMLLPDLAKAMNIARGPSEHVRPINVGLLFFSEHPEDFFPRAWIEVVIHKDYSGKGFEEFYFKGPLHHQLENALSFIKARIIGERTIKVPERAKANRFFNFPYEALEEALANHVYHKSYERQSPIEIQIYPDKIHILSHPGPVPPVDEKMLKTEHHITSREYRNRRIGDFLKELELTEGRGSGFPIIYNAMEKNGSPKPIFKTDADRTFFATILPIHEQYNEIEEQSNTASEKRPSKELTPRQQKIVAYVRENGSITNAVCQELTGVSRSTTSTDLQKMVEIGVLQQSGKTKGATFTLVQ